MIPRKYNTTFTITERQTEIITITDKKTGQKVQVRVFSDEKQSIQELACVYREHSDKGLITATFLEYLEAWGVYCEEVETRFNVIV